MSEPIGSVGWPNGARAAISLTYDGGLPEHLFLVEPLLRTLGLRATFYLSATFFLENPRAWAALAAHGHEIGNQSLFGVTGPRGELPNWTLEMVHEDLLHLEELLDGHVAGPTERSFAYPGDNPITAEGSYEPVVERLFLWARTCHEGLNHAVFCNPLSLRTVRAAGLSGAGLAQRAEEALDLGAWAIFVFESLGSRGRACEERDHESLLRYVAAKHNDLFVAPVREIAEYVVAARERMTVG
ncbi:MAG TPA: polysaccharide deacetylase family protein [Fimbriimonadaceae bacterium]|nr:polysaccharide deacetylase family protein [Fimbriimonadaceae bacterium]